MTQLDSSLFADVADALGIGSPSIAEKDYYAIQSLCLLSHLKSEYYDFVFSGGTCLTKTYKNTYRMSEDVDIKLIPKLHTLQLTRSYPKTKHLHGYFTTTY
jgi:predicted nucleotidyltransferase component of viral defense system